MIKIPELFKGTENFWEFNPEYKIVFDEFYAKDKSKDKEKSSRIMWAFYFKLHPDSSFYNLPDKDNIIIEKIIKDTKFNWEKHELEENLFYSTILTPAERELYDWNTTLHKRRKFLNEQEFTLDSYNDEGRLQKGTADQLDKMLANTAKLYQDYNKIQKELKEEKLKKGKGNKPQSFSDTNEI